ncbi:MAG: TetR/AcrR family transcriptional regulator [Sporichthyaceae bacterium]
MNGAGVAQLGAETAVAPAKGVRRPSAVVRALLIDSARRCFAAKGYNGASTREIAAEAGVHEALIFRHFGNKVSLFREAVVEPFRALIEDFVDRWESDQVPATMSTEELTGAWVQALHEMMRAHRDLVVALIAANAFEADSSGDGQPLTDAFTRPLERLERFTRREMKGRGLIGDPSVSVRALFAMVMSMAVLDDWFFGGLTNRPSREHVTAEMTRMVVYGITGSASADIR